MIRRPGLARGMGGTGGGGFPAVHGLPGRLFEGGHAPVLTAVGAKKLPAGLSKFNHYSWRMRGDDLRNTN